MLALRPCAAKESRALDLYVFALVASIEAETHCAGMKQDTTGLSFLLDQAEIGRPSDADVNAAIRHWKIEAQTAIRDKGEAEWCAAIWRLFGPEGLKAIGRK